MLRLKNIAFVGGVFFVFIFSLNGTPVFAHVERLAFAQTPELYLASPEPDTPRGVDYKIDTEPLAQKNHVNINQNHNLISYKNSQEDKHSSYIVTLSAPERSKISGIPYEKPLNPDGRSAGGPGLSAADQKKWLRKKGWFNKAAYAVDKFFNQPVPEQWSTGTLYELFPPEEKGAWTIEPYFIATTPNGQFDQLGRHVSDNPGSYSFAQQWYLQAGITDRLSVMVTPGYQYNWGGGGRSGSVEAQDIPFDIFYRVTKDNRDPLVTVYLGGQAPVGPYDKLTNANDGTGTGAWSFNFGVSSMMSFPFFGHALITDLWAQANQTTGDVRVKGMSTYGTDQDFDGWAIPSQFGSAGAGFEFGVTKRFMLDLELIGYWNAPVNMKGWEAGVWQNYQESGWTDVFDVSPGLEYSFNEHWGAVAEVVIPVAGVNSSASLSPTAAIVCSY